MVVVGHYINIIGLREGGGLNLKNNNNFFFLSCPLELSKNVISFHLFDLVEVEGLKMYGEMIRRRWWTTTTRRRR